MKHPAARAALVVLVLLFVAVGRGVWRRPVGSLPRGLNPSDLNLLIVTLDTTRADRLGCYGATQVATPNLDRLASEGVLFERAVSAMPLTLPAHSALFTARFPAGSGVRDNGGFKLAPEQTTLAELLGTHGWKTGGFVSAFVLDRRWGIAQGFDTYQDGFDLLAKGKTDMGEIQRSGQETVAAALSWIDSVKTQRFFGWVHLYDPHTPYDPPEPYRSRYKGRPYDGEIAWTDELVGRLLAGLEQAGLTDRTVIAVLGDHGESLGEHGEHGHGFFIYRQTTQIPLILRAPQHGFAGKRVSQTVRIVDVAPTLLDLVGRPATLEGQGLSLRPLIEAAAGHEPREGYSESFYGRYHYGWSELRGIERGRWHFIEAPRPELFDVDADPAETRDLAASHPEVIAELRAAMGELDTATGLSTSAAMPVEEDPETLARLASLGYVGTISHDEAVPFQQLPDPKDRLDVYNLMNHAREENKDGHHDLARALFEQVLAKDPKVIDAWYLLGNIALKAGQYAVAQEHYKQALALRPDHDYAMIGLADTMVAQGRIDDAVLGYERFLQGDPRNAQITYRLAQVLLDAGRPAEAERWFEKTLQLEARTARAEVGRAVVALRMGDLAAARAALDRALALDPKAKHARFDMALVAEEQQQFDEAVKLYRAALDDDRADYRAAFNLGRLLGTRGDAAGSLAALRQACTINPRFATGRFFLAAQLLRQGDLEAARASAEEGLALERDGPFSALGFYVLADVYNRLGRARDAAQALSQGRAAEAAARRRGQRDAQQRVAAEEAEP